MDTLETLWHVVLWIWLIEVVGVVLTIFDTMVRDYFRTGNETEEYSDDQPPIPY